jgi:nucleoside-diphosphate-sugar epimerase
MISLQVENQPSTWQQPFTYLKTERAHKEPGWQPTPGLVEGLEQTVEYYRTAESSS